MDPEINSHFNRPSHPLRGTIWISVVTYFGKFIAVNMDPEINGHLNQPPHPLRGTIWISVVTKDDKGVSASMPKFNAPVMLSLAPRG